MKPITILLAEDHMIVREGLRALLQLEDDIKVIGEAENGRQAVEMAGRLAPDVVVMDISMPLLNGMEATRQILQACPETKVLVLSAHTDDGVVGRIMEAGASGYLVKQTAANILRKAVRAIHGGANFFSPEISQRLDHHQNRAHLRGDLPAKKKANKLSSREMEVLQLVAEGKANKETAAELNISVKTVEKHRQKVMEKLNIHDTAGLTRHAIAAGIISVQTTTL